MCDKIQNNGKAADEAVDTTKKEIRVWCDGW